MQESMEKIFSRLNNRLSESGLYLNIICVGGYVLKYHGIRETKDIDGFYDNSPVIRKIIKEIGNEFNLNQEEEDWINNSVGNLNEKPDDSICKIIYSNSNLKIMIPPLEYVAGMKLRSEREIDISDVSDIIVYLKIDDPRDFKDKLDFYGFNDVDESLIMESFAEAYGLDWLENYYTSYEHDVIDSMVNSSEKNYKNYSHNDNSDIFNMEIIEDVYRDPLRKLILCKYESLRENFLADRVYRLVNGKKMGIAQPSKESIKLIVNEYKKQPDFEMRCKEFMKSKEGKDFLSSLRKL